MTETGGSTAVAAPVNVDDPHASEEAAKLAEPEHHAGHAGKSPSKLATLSEFFSDVL
jgi:hypothetical protein